jgi:8-oxo-dGTP diphosphatase
MATAVGIDLPFAHLAITDRALGSTDLVALAAMSGALLFRDKDMASQERLELGRDLRARTTALSIPLIVHGDVALARKLGAQGLHLPASVPPSKVGGLWVGCSCHNTEELERAAAACVDYVTLSPVLGSPGKARPMGWEAFAELAQNCPMPVFALGGLGPDNLKLARAWGGWGVAGIRGFVARVS